MRSDSSSGATAPIVNYTVGPASEDERALTVEELLTDHPIIITVTHGMSGWFAVMMVWNKGEPGFPGFYEPENTGAGRYASREEAVEEARGWAEDEGIEFQDGQVSTDG